MQTESQTDSDDVVIRVEGLWKRHGRPLPDIYYKAKRRFNSLLNGRHIAYCTSRIAHRRMV